MPQIITPLKVKIEPMGFPAATCRWHSKDLVILPNFDTPTSYRTKIDIIRIGELILENPTGMNGRGPSLMEPIRVTNIDQPFGDLTVDITRAGNLGLDEGYSLLPNRGYLLWALTNGKPDAETQFRLTTGIGDGPTGAPDGYDYKAPLYFTWTDSNGYLVPITKMDVWSGFGVTTGPIPYPLIHSGVSSGTAGLGGTTDFIGCGGLYDGSGNFIGKASPTGGFNFRILVTYGTNGKTTKIGESKVSREFVRVGKGDIITEKHDIFGWAGTAIWFESDDPALVISMHSFDDQF